MNEETGPRRFSDEMLWRLDQKIEDHLKWSENQTSAFENRIKELEAFRHNIETPVHAAGWLIITLVGSFVVAVGTYLWKLIARLHL